MFEVPLIIGGRDTPAGNHATFERRDPVTIVAKGLADTAANADP